MRHGDISNHVSPSNAGVRLNGFLVDPGRMGIARRTLFALGGKINQKAIDPVVARFVENLYYRTSFTVDLVYLGGTDRLPAVYVEAVRDVPHNRVHLVEDLHCAERLLYGGVLSYFVTTPQDVSMMNGGHAYTVEQFGPLIKKSFRQTT